MKSSESSPTPRARNLLRELSDQAVLETVFREGPITRPELAARTGLSKPTVSEAVRRLMQERLIRSAGVRSGSLGRSPVSYVVDNSAGYVIGVDVGGTNVRVAAVDLYGEVLVRRTEQQTTDGGRSLAHQINALVRETIRTAGATHTQLLAVGASVLKPERGGPGAGGGPGPARPDAARPDAAGPDAFGAGTLGADTLGADAFGRRADPLGLLRDQLDVPVLVDSSINLSAVGEKWRGLAAGVSDFVFVSVGASVGTGLVVGDQLVRGAHLAAGNIAALPGSPAGLLGERSGRTPLESMGARALVEQAARFPWAGEVPRTIAEIFDRLEADPSALEVLHAEAARIAFAIATVCAIVDPELVVLGGGIGSYPQLLGPVRELSAAQVPHAVRIESSLLGDQAALYGALAVALRDAREQLFRRSLRPASIAHDI
jgi:predicted NBD/HSP70 family sugar kinase